MGMSFEQSRSLATGPMQDRVAELFQAEEPNELVALAKETLTSASSNPELLEHLMSIVDRLGADETCLQQALQAARNVAIHSPAGTELRQRALASMLKFAEALLMQALSRAVEDMCFVAQNATPEWPVEQQAMMMWTTLIRMIAMHDPGVALALARSTADGANPGGSVEQMAVASWSDQIVDVSQKEPLKAIASSRYAADYAEPGSLLERSAVASWLQQIDALARQDIGQAVGAVQEAMRSFRVAGALRQAALSKENELLGATPREAGVGS